MSASAESAGGAHATRSRNPGGGPADHQKNKNRPNNRRGKKNRPRGTTARQQKEHDGSGSASTSGGNLTLDKDAAGSGTFPPQQQHLGSSSEAAAGSGSHHQEESKNRPSRKKGKKTKKSQPQDQSQAVDTLLRSHTNTEQKGYEDHRRGHQQDREQNPSRTDNRRQDAVTQEKAVKGTEDTRKRGAEVIEPIDGEVEAEIKALEKEFVFKLKKKSAKFPMARFFCRLCDYHCDTVMICRRHVKDTRHLRLKTIKTTDIFLKHLPPPTAAHCARLTQVLEQVVEQQGISKQQVADRHEAFEIVKAKINAKLPAVEMSLYGSTLSGFALKSSDLNIDIAMATSPLILKELYLMLKDDKSGYFSNVQSDFTSKVPVVLAHLPSVGVTCQIGINNTAAVRTSQLLAVYTQLDPRVTKLGVLFKCWAKLCKVDEQTKGTLPSYVFGLMAVQFCQQLPRPLLPILHEIETKELADLRKKPGGEHIYFSDLSKLDEHFKLGQCSKNLGSLWIALLKYYIMEFDLQTNVVCIRQKEPLARQAKKWASKKVAIEDPFQRRRNVARSLSHPRLFEYINDRIRAAYKYFAIPQTKAGPLFEDLDHGMLQERLEESMRLLQERSEKEGSRDQSTEPSKGSQQQQDGSKSTSQEQPQAATETVNSQEQEMEQIPQDEGSQGRDQDADGSADVDGVVKSLDALKLAADNAQAAGSDSDDEKQATRSVVEEYASEMLDSIIRDCIGNLKKEVATELAGDQEAVVDSKEDDESGSELSSSTEETCVKDAEEEKKEADDSDSEAAEVVHDNNAAAGEDSTDSVDNGKAVTAESCQNLGLMSNGNLIDDSAVSVVRADDLIFKFDESTLTDAQGPALMCSICQREGHLKQCCPEEVLPEVQPLPPMTAQYRAILDCILHQVPNDFEPTPRELQSRGEVVIELQTFIRSFYPDAELSLFGSSCNGFGFRDSDLDICMTFTQPTPEGLDCVEIIENLAKKLRKHRSFYNVFAISTAKVPIVKFKHRRSQLEGDISLYNTLAQHNTRMLSLYSMVDYRVKILGYTMKVFAKLCDICDASRGSLSSYAYTLMVLYFLQQRNPPVIPVLQELHDESKPEVIVDSWNAWFFADKERLPKVWPEFGQNKESPAQLWVGLLSFYSEEFNFNDCVMSIRQKQLLTKFEKLWNGKCMAIEDPFDLSHNLGVGLSRKMNVFIQRTFRSGRMLFGVPIDRPPPRYHSMQDYLFDPDLLSDGQPPNDRGCRICSKIGHIAKECPWSLQAKKERQGKHREEEKRRQEGLANSGGHNSNREPQQQQHASAPRHIPRNTYERSLSHGHTPPDFASGRSPQTGGQGYERSYSHTPPRNIAAQLQGTPPRQGAGRVINTQVFHSSQIGAFPASPTQLQHQGGPQVIYVNPQQMGGGNHGNRQQEQQQQQQHSKQGNRHSNYDTNEFYRDQQGSSNRHRNQQLKQQHGNQDPHHSNMSGYHGNPQHGYQQQQHGNGNHRQPQAQATPNSGTQWQGRR